MVDAALQSRIDAVRRRLALAEVVARVAKLGNGTKERRCVCPFHNGKSQSFVVYPSDHKAHCFGCGWHGDVIKFVMDDRGLSFIDGLKQCEGLTGLADAAAALEGSGRVTRQRNPTTSRPRERQFIEPIDFGRFLWRCGRAEPGAVRRYFRGRGVPEAVLSDTRLVAFRFVGRGPVSAWEVGARPSSVLQAPAIVALVRRPQFLTCEQGGTGRLEFVPVGVHVTFLNPDGTGTMVRRKPWAKPGDEDPWLPRRKMLGPVGHGAVLLGDYRAAAPLFVGEGNETVLSGMALADAPPGSVGVATLSLDNLQGFPKLWKNGAWPLHAIEPDPERPACFIIPGHLGRVTGLIDSDMSPLLGPRDRGTGVPRGMPVVERKGGPLLRRAIDGGERARICGELFVKGWRKAGIADVRAVRAPLGMDFNDVVQSQSLDVARDERRVAA